MDKYLKSLQAVHFLPLKLNGPRDTRTRDSRTVDCVALKLYSPVTIGGLNHLSALCNSEVSAFQRS